MKSAWSGHGYRRLVIEYFTAVLLVAAAAILTWLLRHPFPGIPSSLFFCAVILSAWLGGLGPAFIASILSSATIILWLPWRPVVAPTVANEIPVFLVFLFASLFISWLSDRKRRAQAALRQARDLLEQRVEERTRELKAANEDLKTECAERKKIENALSQSEARLEEAQRMAHMGHWDRDVFTGQITCSDEFLRIFGLPPRPTPLNLTEVQHIIHPDDRARQRQALAEAQQGLRRYDMEYRIIMPDGEVRIVHSLKEAREAVHRIARDGNRAGEVIRRIRTLIKKGEPVRTLLNLNQLIQETLTLTQPELTRKQVSLQTELAPDLPRVPADRIQLQQVLLNLVMNALDSMSAVADRQRVLRIRTDRSESDAVQIAVQDNGIGLGPVGTEQVFQPFYTTKPDGLGMGLAISRSIVEAHGGRLWATPNDGFGATFQFTLPVQEGGQS